MNKLDEIEAKANNTLYVKEIFESDSYLNGPDVSLLIRAVRQLSKERRAFQSLFEAVDDIMPPSGSDTYIDDDLKAAFDAVMNTPEPEDDVLELLKETQ